MAEGLHSNKRSDSGGSSSLSDSTWVPPPPSITAASGFPQQRSSAKTNSGFLAMLLTAFHDVVLEQTEHCHEVKIGRQPCGVLLCVEQHQRLAEHRPQSQTPKQVAAKAHGSRLN
jgi:hypothetical protein